jgi:virulence-associated protein VagC
VSEAALERVHEALQSADPEAHDVVETRVFRSGNSDAVRLPKGFGMSGKEVRLRKLPGGRVLVEPVTKRGWPAGFFESLTGVTPDFTIAPRERHSAAEEKRARGLFR